jgi:protein arginine N-methyltransferase 1
VSEGELSEHLAYWTDPAKLDAYQRAIEAVVRPGDVVVDLGCGTGLLGLMAARAGARRVYAIDAGDILTLARDLAIANGYGDVITHLRGMSTDIELPELADVVVGDQIGGLAYDCGVLEYYADARRFLRSGGRLVPEAFELSLRAVQAPEAWDEIDGWSTRHGGFALDAARQLSINTYRTVHLAPANVLSPRAVGPTVASDRFEHFSFETETTITRAGCLHGVVGIFHALMAPGVVMTNDPADAGRMARRWQNLYPVDRPVPVVPGDRVGVWIDADPPGDAATWEIIVTTANGRHVSRGSTHLGQFLGSEQLAASDPRRVVAPSTRHRIVRDALELVDGHRTTGEIEQALTSRYPGESIERISGLTSLVASLS